MTHHLLSPIYNAGIYHAFHFLPLWATIIIVAIAAYCIVRS